MKKVVVSVTNDLVTDRRVARSIEVLEDLGYEICFVGRKLEDSLPINRTYQTIRFKLPFTKGVLFYASYNLRLFWFLLFRRFDVYLSNDLDTLLPNYIASRIWRKPLLYDTHEYFTGVPEIQHRPVVKAVWVFLEKWLFKKPKAVITVNQSIADIYFKLYGVKAKVVRNISDSDMPAQLKTREELGLPLDKFLLINQGAGINVDRGMEEMLETLKLLPDCALVLVGAGDVLPKLKEMVAGTALQEQVIFISKRPYLEMLQYTLAADAGISLDKDTNPNYQFSLPNKLFDYIKCQKPIICSGVVEVKRIVTDYNIGAVIASHSALDIAQAVREVQKNRSHYAAGLVKAAAENNWEFEREKLKAVLSLV